MVEKCRYMCLVGQVHQVSLVQVAPRDFYMLEMCEFTEFLSDDSYYSQNERAKRYVRRVTNLNGLKTYVNGVKYYSMHFNNPAARVNNKTL